MNKAQKKELETYCFKVGIPACEALEVVADYGWGAFLELRRRIAYEYQADLRAGESHFAKFRRLRGPHDRDLRRWFLERGQKAEVWQHASESNPAYKPDFWQLFKQMQDAGRDAMIILEGHRNMERVEALKLERRIASAALRVLFDRDEVESALRDDAANRRIDQEEYARRSAIIEEVYGNNEEAL